MVSFSGYNQEQEEAWREFAREVAGEFVKGSDFRLGPFRFSGDWRPAKVVARVNQWTITLDTDSTGGGYGGSKTVTRMTAPYIARHPGFLFEIYPPKLSSNLGKVIGMQQDIEVGYPDLDRAFIITGSDESMIRALFANQRVRQLVHGPPPAYINVRQQGNLRVLRPGLITDVARLKSLYDLLTETLNQLVEIGVASDEAPPAEGSGTRPR